MRTQLSFFSALVVLTASFSSQVSLNAATGQMYIGFTSSRIVRALNSPRCPVERGQQQFNQLFDLPWAISMWPAL